jgi:hypothetical protein
LQRFQPQPQAEQTVASGSVEGNTAAVAAEKQEPCGIVPSYGPDEWDEARALAVQAAVHTRLDAAVAAMPADHPDRQARLNVLVNERGIVAGLLAKHDPILWGWLDSLERMLQRWCMEDAAKNVH